MASVLAATRIIVWTAQLMAAGIAELERRWNASHNNIIAQINLLLSFLPPQRSSVPAPPPSLLQPEHPYCLFHSHFHSNCGCECNGRVCIVCGLGCQLVQANERSTAGNAKPTRRWHVGWYSTSYTSIQEIGRGSRTW
ncbi:unnamed protein product [Orchesella dallaii]|uniref:Uncharacterized protein n=1 Tax=Orchesella dallaii TaxID=48710 RepID=A0ABP1S456_9HEXA